ncbi:MAG: glycosyltransferase family 4 protein [Candidatus Omnitrophica bacterium]|nr:glycosyltransferase family 4 protein [Candidatus Omnitrophota bacterium]
MKKTGRPKLLVISPIANLSLLEMGCRVRIFNILRAAREKFEITFLSTSNQRDILTDKKVLQSLCSRVIILPSCYTKNFITRALHRTLSGLACYLFGIPKSYYLGSLNLSPKRVKKALDNDEFAIVLFEYWYSAASLSYFKNKGIPCVLDMHDILWQWRAAQIDAIGSFNNAGKSRKGPGRLYQKFLIKRYRTIEEKIWRQFSQIISINHVEDEYLRQKIPQNISTLIAGMGVDLAEWPYCWKPAKPQRIIFYGSLSGEQNEQAALRCANRIMPLVWPKVPDAELWLVGARPSNKLQALAGDSRVKITGFIERVQETLASATVMICPLKGTYGFRSRVIEAMALGVPVIATDEAIYGMNLDNERGLIIQNNDQGIAEAVNKFLASAEQAKKQSLFARKQIEEKFSFQDTYGRITSFLVSCLRD